MLESDPDVEFEYPELYANRFEDVHVTNPTWGDVPEVRTLSRDEVGEVVRNTTEGVFDNGATKRFEAVTEVAYHYRRYRRACCTPRRSRIEAIKRAAEYLEVSEQAVRGHLQTLSTDDGHTDSVVDQLEEIDHELVQFGNPLSRQLTKTCERLVRVLDEIVTIDRTPSIEPTDIRVEDAKLDDPEKRRRVLDTDGDVMGVIGDHPASYSDRRLERQMLIEDQENPEYFTEEAKIRTRDIATYSTEYSRVVRKIFNAVQSEMRLRGKQKPGPTISTDGDDNSAVRAVLPYPDIIDSTEPFARISVMYWESGGSDVSISTHPEPDIIHDETDPRLSGPIDSITKPSIYALIGESLEIAECLD